MSDYPIQHTSLSTNGVHLHVVQAGSDDGPLVILLHGFPEFWYGWRKQIMPLADAGFRVLVPDQRGYNLSGKPSGISAYKIDTLAADIVGLMDAADREKCFLAGHDWGAAVAWMVALHYPERLEKLVILNVPHPAVMQRTLWTNLPQLLKSWYIFFFQLPYLPEVVLRANNWGPAANMLMRSGKPGSFSKIDLEQYRQAWGHKDAFTSMLNWYRAAVCRQPKLPPDLRIRVPTLMLWGVHDVALSQGMAQQSIDLCDKGRLVFFEQATHWVQHDEAEEVTKMMVAFFRGTDEPIYDQNCS